MKKTKININKDKTQKMNMPLEKKLVALQKKRSEIVKQKSKLPATEKEKETQEKV